MLLPCMTAIGRGVQEYSPLRSSDRHGPDKVGGGRIHDNERSHHCAQASPSVRVRVFQPEVAFLGLCNPVPAAVARVIQHLRGLIHCLPWSHKQGPGRSAGAPDGGLESCRALKPDRKTQAPPAPCIAAHEDLIPPGQPSKSRRTETEEGWRRSPRQPCRCPFAECWVQRRDEATQGENARYE